MINSYGANVKLNFLLFRLLDISFNRVQKIENLDALVSLEKLFLCSNKITLIENLSPLTNLTMLELGDNKIRVKELTYFWLSRFNRPTVACF